ncbi:MAG TPA: hypothetical protein VKA36_10965 [Solirubrobacterales bacterium]|nr:hypothetical protein [Solirubrobacterales bacterium]
MSADGSTDEVAYEAPEIEEAGGEDAPAVTAAGDSPYQEVP